MLNRGIWFVEAGLSDFVDFSESSDTHYSLGESFKIQAVEVAGGQEKMVQLARATVSGNL